MTDRPQRLRVLLSEGSSTSAREIITALGRAGHAIEICDPDRHCLGRLSGFVRRFHRCPGIAADPEGYLDFIVDLVSRERFDVLLPTHEQGYVFARAPARLAPHVAVALPSFESYGQALDKARFSRLLSELGLPQPATEFITDPRALGGSAGFPLVVKTAIGTASRGIWMIRNAHEFAQAIAELEARAAFADTVLVQEMVAGPIEHAQAVFCAGRLIAVHAYRQIARGAGGGPAIKESVRRPAVRQHLAQLGTHLAWHGALSVDYILADGVPRYIDCNPRLVEPMNALAAGLDLTDLLVRVSLGETPPEAPDSRPGTRTHIAIQALLGCALEGGTRADLLTHCRQLLARSGPYAGSLEELTPVRSDWLSALPPVAAAVALAASPKAAAAMARKGWGDHLLTVASMRLIRERISPVGSRAEE